MRENTDRRRKKRGAVIVAAIFAVCLIPIVFLLLVLTGVVVVEGGWLAAPFLFIYALIPAAVIIGVIRAAVQRSREIDSGEEEEAKKY